MIHDLKPYPAMKDSGVPWLGQVPEHWEVQPALAVYRPREVKNKGMSETTVLSLSYGRIIVKPEEKLRGLVPESFETYQIVQPGNIIVRTTDLQNDKNSLRIGHAKNKGIITSAYMCLETTDRVLNEFGYQYLNAYDLLKIIYGYGSGLRQNLDFKDIRRMPVLLPLPGEQAAIVRFLDHADRRIRKAIAAKQRLIKLLQEQKQVIIHQAVTRGLDPNVKLKHSGVEWLGDVPEGWRYASIRRFARVFAGATPSRANEEYWLNGTIPWLASGDVNKRRITEAEQFITEAGFSHSSTKWIRPKSVIIALAGQGRTKGLCATVEVAVTCNQSLAAIEPNLKVINYEYLSYYLESRYVDIRALVGELRDGLNLEHIKSIFVPFPSLSEQQAIVHYIETETSKLNQAITRAQSEISLLREYRTRLIADVVMGKLDVREAAAQLPEPEQDTLTDEVELEEGDELNGEDIDSGGDEE